MNKGGAFEGAMSRNGDFQHFGWAVFLKSDMGAFFGGRSPSHPAAEPEAARGTRGWGLCSYGQLNPLRFGTEGQIVFNGFQV